VLHLNLREVELEILMRDHAEDIRESGIFGSFFHEMGQVKGLMTNITQAAVIKKTFVIYFFS
jgi:hypothetical protein